MLYEKKSNQFGCASYLCKLLMPTSRVAQTDEWYQKVKAKNERKLPENVEDTQKAILPHERQKERDAMDILLSTNGAVCVDDKLLFCLCLFCPEGSSN